MYVECQQRCKGTVLYLCLLTGISSTACKDRPKIWLSLHIEVQPASMFTAGDEGVTVLLAAPVLSVI